MAEGAGFEPAVLFWSTDAFEASGFNRSPILPVGNTGYLCYIFHAIHLKTMSKGLSIIIQQSLIRVIRLTYIVMVCQVSIDYCYASWLVMGFLGVNKREGISSLSFIKF